MLLLLLLLTHQLWYLLPKQLLKLLAGARVAAGSWHQPLMLQGAAAGWHQLPLLLAGTSCRYCWLAPAAATAGWHQLLLLLLLLWWSTAAAAWLLLLLLSTCCCCLPAVTACWLLRHSLLRLCFSFLLLFGFLFWFLLTFAAAAAVTTAAGVLLEKEMNSPSFRCSRETLAHCPAATNTPYKSKVCVARGEELKRCC